MLAFLALTPSEWMYHRDVLLGNFSIASKMQPGNWCRKIGYVRNILELN
jgi:hypothetical protein